MIIIGIILGFVGLAYLCWLLFSLAVYALPFFAGVTVGFATYHSGSGPIVAIIVGAIAASITLIAAHIAFTTFRSPRIRAVIALLFAAPAAIAGIMPRSASRTSAYPARAGDRPSQLRARSSWPPWRARAWRSLARPIADRAVPPAVTSPDPLTSLAKQS